LSLNLLDYIFLFAILMQQAASFICTVVVKTAMTIMRQTEGKLNLGNLLLTLN